MSLTETVKEVEKKLMEAGEKLLQPPASVEELLTLLDLAENTLGKVEQSPGKSMHDALSSLRKALVSDELLGHTDADVKASVASCISEVTRITAPDAPYDDDKMKKVFQLIVSSFEDLSDESSRSYKKRAVILETLAKVRSCVIMLDLECDDLITDMFQTFFQTIRDYHPSSIYTSMETIMNLVLEESEEVSTDLLTTLLSSVKRENEEVPPIARRLGESILGTCAVKLKPYLTQAIKYSGISLDNYSNIVTSVCEGTVGEDASNALIQQPSDGCKAAAVSIEVTQEGDGCKAAAASSEATQEGDGSKAATASSKETQVDVKDVKRNSLGDKSPAPRLSLKITMSNGTSLTSIEKTSGKVESSQKGETSENDNKSINDEAILEPESRSSGVEKSTLSASKSRKTTKNRRKRASSSKKSESSEPSHVDGEKEAKVLSDNLVSHEKDVDSSLDNDVSPKVKNVESDKETADIEALKDATTASPSTSPGKASESLPERDHQQEIECATQGDVSSPERVTEKESERPSDSGEASGESPVKVPQESPLRDETSVEIGTSKQDSGTSDSEDTPVKKPSKKSDLSDNDDDDDSPLKRIEDSIKRARTKARSAKSTSKSSTKKDLKVMSSHNRTAKSSKVEENEGEILSKRKRSLGKGEASGPVKYGKNEPLKYGKNLIRSKVKVWWPIDNEFYKGVIVSYDPEKRKHLVVYDDGDEELLNLRKEKWQLIGDDSVTVTDDDAEPASTDASSEMPKSKKAKRTATSSVKQQDLDDVSPKRLSASSSKSKGKSSKSDKKSASKSDAISEDESGSKSKTHSQSGSKSKAHSQKSSGKPIYDTPKSSGKVKDLDNAALKSKSKQDTSASKSKEDTPKIAVKGKTQGSGSKSNEDTPKIAVKGKIQGSGSKSNVNGSGKGKSNLSKGKGSHVQEKRSESPEVPESTKRKFTDFSNEQGSLAKFAKKKRSVKG